METVLIDSRVAGNDGIGRFTRNIIEKINEQDKEILRYLTRDNNYALKLAPKYEDLSKHYTLDEITVFDKAKKVINPKLIHCTDYRVPIEKLDIPLIVSIHDIFRYTDDEQCYDDAIFIKRYSKEIFNEMIEVTKNINNHIAKKGRIAKRCEAETSNKAHFNYYASMLEWALISSDIVATPTIAVKSEIMANFNIENRIEVINYGVNHTVEFNAYKKADIEGLPKPYFLYVGQLRKHKNVELVIDSFEEVHKKVKDVYLLLVGKDFKNNKYIESVIKEKGLDNYVICMGYVNDLDLIELYKKASALVHLALYEGFGFTPLEAMSHGCKVIASKNVTAIELLDGKAKMVEVNDIISTSEAMIDSLDTNEKEGNILYAKGFSWQKTAERFIGLYKELIKNK